MNEMIWITDYAMFRQTVFGWGARRREIAYSLEHFINVRCTALYNAVVLKKLTRGQLLPTDIVRSTVPYTGPLTILRGACWRLSHAIMTLAVTQFKDILFAYASILHTGLEAESLQCSVQSRTDQTYPMSRVGKPSARVRPAGVDVSTLPVCS